jgi:hypothetical protein
MSLIRQPTVAIAMLLAMLALALIATSGSAGAAIANLTISAPAASDRVAGRVDARYDVQFTTNVANPATQVIVTFPVGYTIGASATVRDTAGNANRVTLNGVTNVQVSSVTTNPGSRQITINLLSGTPLHGGWNGFRINTGVTNPPVSGVTGPIAVSTNAAGEVASGVVTTITPGALANAAVTPQSAGTGVTGNVVLSFTTANPLPTNGRIVVTFPAGFVLNNGAVTQVVADNIAEAVTIAVSSQTANVQLLGGGTGKAGGAPVTLTLSNVRNPLTAGTTSTFAVSTRTATGVVIDSANAPGAAIGAVAQPGGAPGQGDRVTVCPNGRYITIARAAAERAAWRDPGHPQFARLNRCP